MSCVPVLVQPVSLYNPPPPHPPRGGGSGPCSVMKPLPHLRYLFPALLQLCLCASSSHSALHSLGSLVGTGAAGPVVSLARAPWTSSSPASGAWLTLPFLFLVAGRQGQEREPPSAGKIWKIKFPQSSQWRRCVSSPQPFLLLLLLLFLSDQPCLSCCLPSHFPA